MTAMIELANAEKTFTMHLQGGVELPVARWRAFWHVGYLGSIHAAPGSMIGRYDARLGVQAGWQDWRAELSFDAARKRPAGGLYYSNDVRTTREVVLAVSRAF